MIRAELQATPLYFATYKGHKSTVAVLLEKNGITDMPGSNGKTAFNIALERGHVDIALMIYLIVPPTVGTTSERDLYNAIKLKAMGIVAYLSQQGHINPRKEISVGDGEPKTP